jgi:hypothetical protein
LQEFGKGRHGGGSEVLGDLLEFFKWRPLTVGESADRVLQAVVDVILNQRAFGLTHRFLNRMQLLGNVNARASIFDHANNAAQMAFGTLQPFDDVAMTLVLVAVFVIAHALSLVRR